LEDAERRGFRDILGNVVALFVGSTAEQRRIPDFLDSARALVGMHPNHYGEFISQACSSIDNGVNRLSRYAEENAGVEGYAVVGASEIIGPEWKPDNFDSIMFGDLGGVAIFRITPRLSGLEASERGVVGCVDVHDLDTDNIIVRGDDGFLYMDGKAVMKYAPRAMITDCRESARRAGLAVSGIDRFVFHTGSKHIFRPLRTGMERVYGADFDFERQAPQYLEDSGNNGAVTTLNVFHRARTDGTIRAGHTVYMGAVGMGFYRSGLILRP